MMQAAGLERAAKDIADNVVAAWGRAEGSTPLHASAREAMVAALVRHLLRALPTDSPAALAAACNRALDEVVGAMGLAAPRVEAVDLADGSVTMRAPDAA